MKNKLIVISLGFGGLATLLGIISTSGIMEERGSLNAFHLGSSAFFLGLMSVLILISSKFWKD